MAIGNNIRLPSFPPSFPGGGRRRKVSKGVDVFQQRFLIDMEEAEPWQKEFIQYHRDETTKESKKKSNIPKRRRAAAAAAAAAGGAGGGAGGGRARESAHP